MNFAPRRDLCLLGIAWLQLPLRPPQLGSLRVRAPDRPGAASYCHGEPVIELHPQAFCGQAMMGVVAL